MEIQVGEYVRTDKGHIYLYTQQIQKDIQLQDFILCNEGKVTKHSKDIIDLIEIGDYVNGYRVLDIMEDMKTGEIHLEMPMDYTNEEIGDCTIYNKDIKTIVTHEQFKQVEYEV